MKPSRAGLVVVAVVSLSACAGPLPDFTVGSVNPGVNLILGAQAAVVAAPVGPITVPIPVALTTVHPAVPVAVAPAATPPSSAPAVVSAKPLPTPSVKKPTTAPASASPEDSDSPTPSASPDPCPTYGPISPTYGTGVVITGPPAAGSYTYRAHTDDTVDGTSTKYDGPSTWTVTVGAVNSTGGYDVTVVTTIGTASSTRVFLIQPEPVTANSLGTTPLDAPNATDPNYYVDEEYNSLAAASGLPLIPAVAPNVGRYGPAGIYLVSQSTGSTTFTPSVPIPLVQTPIGQNSFTGVGTDGTTAETFTSTVNKNVNVNACGVKVQGIEVDLTNGLIAGPASDGSIQKVSFTETFDFGLQFGGLPLYDAGTVTSASVTGGNAVSRSFDYTVNSKPLPPAQT